MHSSRFLTQSLYKCSSSWLVKGEFSSLLSFSSVESLSELDESESELEESEDEDPELVVPVAVVVLVTLLSCKTAENLRLLCVVPVLDGF